MDINGVIARALHESGATRAAGESEDWYLLTERERERYVTLGRTVGTAVTRYLRTPENMNRIAEAIYRAGAGKHPQAKTWNDYAQTAHGATLCDVGAEVVRKICGNE